MTDYKKLYEEALERAKKWLYAPNSDKIPTYANRVINGIFPELVESEDEKIRKEIISIVKSYRESCITEGNHRFDDCLAWLEKQSKLEDSGNQDKQHLYDIIAALWDLLDKIDTFSDLQIDDTRPHNPFRKIEDITQERHKFVKSDGYNLYIKGEKITDFKQQSEQKTNKIEPKFNVGDWVVYDMPDGRKVIIQIIGMTNKSYILDCEDFNTFYFNDLENDYHLWTIEDAKDGDVICYKDEISLYKYDIKNCTKQETTFGGFVYYCCYDGKRFVIDSLYSLTEQDKMDIHPSTKEQRDILFQKMKESGYEWDVDKKELKKIEQEETELPKGEDYAIDGLWQAIQILEHSLGEVDWCQSDDGILEHKCAIEAVKRLYKQKPAWSEDDEKNFSSLCEFFTAFGSKHYTSYLRKEEMEKWLFHRFKNFPPKQEEWNDEDKDRLDSIKDNLRHVTYKSDVVKHKDFEWLGNLPYRVNLLSKHYWSEDDKEQLDRALYMMEQFNMTKSWDDVYNWLKSLKDRI